MLLPNANARCCFNTTFAKVSKRLMLHLHGLLLLQYLANFVILLPFGSHHAQTNRVINPTIAPKHMRMHFLMPNQPNPFALLANSCNYIRLRKSPYLTSTCQDTSTTQHRPHFVQGAFPNTLVCMFSFP